MDEKKLNHHHQYQQTFKGHRQQVRLWTRHGIQSPWQKSFLWEANNLIDWSGHTQGLHSYMRSHGINARQVLEERNLHVLCFVNKFTCGSNLLPTLNVLSLNVLTFVFIWLCWIICLWFSYFTSFARLLCHIQLFATLWIIAHEAPLSMGFPRQEYWSGLLYSSPGALPNPGIWPAFPASPTLQVDSLLLDAF